MTEYFLTPLDANLFFYRQYLPDLERARQQREETLRRSKDDSMNRLMKDLAIDKAKNPTGPLSAKWEDEEDEEDCDENDVIDRCESFIGFSSLNGFSVY